MTEVYSHDMFCFIYLVFNCQKFAILREEKSYIFLSFEWKVMMNLCSVQVGIPLQFVKTTIANEVQEVTIYNSWLSEQLAKALPVYISFTWFHSPSVLSLGLSASQSLRSNDISKTNSSIPAPQLNKIYLALSIRIWEKYCVCVLAQMHNSCAHDVGFKISKLWSPIS